IRGKMLAWKVATLGLLVFAILSPQRVSAAYPTCTGTQKREILLDCRSYIRMYPHPPRLPLKKDSSCCESVRQVPNRNMLCVIAMLSDEEKRSYSEDKILKLQELCAPPPPPPELVMP
ncbi:hypothetical protein EJB05_28706, partial [Eragrostis curvula]